jgi:hypothetical protein
VLSGSGLATIEKIFVLTFDLDGEWGGFKFASSMCQRLVFGATITTCKKPIEACEKK